MTLIQRRVSRTTQIVWWTGAVFAAVAGVAVVRTVDANALAGAWDAARRAPASAAGVLAIYGAAFALRAALWQRVLPCLGFAQAYAALHVSLLGNHVLPFRLGEALRVTSVVRRADVSLEAATASTVALRSADVVALAGLGLVVAPGLVAEVVGAWVWVVAGGAVLATAGAAVWLTRIRRHRDSTVRLPAGVVIGGAALAWALEASVIWQAAAWTGIEISPAEAVGVTAVTIAAQLLAVAPGGFGTYEAAATAALVTLGADTGTALAAALSAHAVKTAYAFVAGGVSLLLPGPGMFGRFRLPPPNSNAGEPRTAGEGPIVFFLPARNEEATVAQVVEQIPRSVDGHPVVRLVVDDGSQDATADAAARAGAEVVSLGAHRGLGAAVRRGFEEAAARNAAAVVFCDADGEYAPGEAVRLVEPILAGDAHYVVGSRFTGEIQLMHPHRRLGNVVLTRLLSFVARHRITDGQTGYRALSGQAARAAEVIHDFNYAQVLTLDLLAKGFGYAEVPITYRFRESGQSFVRLVPYLRSVLPAVHRELNAAR